jgi:predicted nucleic acid-binding protein
MAYDKIYYFDANALVKFFIKDTPNVREKGIKTIQQLVQNNIKSVFISPLTVLECVGTILKFGRRQRNTDKTYLTRKQVNTIISEIKSTISNNSMSYRPFRLIPMSKNAYLQAEDLLLEHRKSHLQVNDALHLVTYQALREKIPTKYQLIMATSDSGIKTVCEKKQIPVFDGELNPVKH